MTIANPKNKGRKWIMLSAALSIIGYLTFEVFQAFKIGALRPYSLTGESLGNIALFFIGAICAWRAWFWPSFIYTALIVVGTGLIIAEMASRDADQFFMLAILTSATAAMCVFGLLIWSRERDEISKRSN